MNQNLNLFLVYFNGIFWSDQIGNFFNNNTYILMILSEDIEKILNNRFYLKKK